MTNNDEIVRVLKILIKDGMDYGYTLNPRTLDINLFNGEIKDEKQ